MNAQATHIGFPCARSRISAFAAALALITSVGCWQEIRYDPSQEPSEPPARPVGLSDETPTEQPAAAPSAKQLFAGEPGEEKPDQEQPLWDGMESETASVTSTEPAPPAVLDWPDESPEEESPEEESPVEESPVEESPEEEQPEIAAVPTPADPRTALAAWRMASKWSLAVGVFGKGWPADRYVDMWQQAEFAAQLLRVPLPALPENVAIDEQLSAATTLLLEESGPQLAEAVGAEHSATHRALCDLAIKTHALLLIYTPNGSQQKPLIVAIRQAAEDSPLPERLWKPVVDLLDAGADFQEAKRAIFELHNRAAKYLGDLVAP
jgi:hypothetical protein